MKRMLTVTLWAFGLLAMAPAVWGQPGDEPRREPPRREGVRPLAVLKDVVAKLNLTEEQAKQVKEAMDKAQADLTAAMDKAREELQKLEGEIKAAREAKDEAKLRELMAQRAKLLPNPMAVVRELRQKIKPILTEEQNKALDKALEEALKPPMPPTRPGELLERVLKNAEKLALTDEQKGKLEGLLKDFREAMKKLGEGADEKARRELGEKLLKDVREVLGDKWEKVRGLLAPPPPGPGDRLERLVKELSLTAEQSKAVAELQAKFADAVKTAETPDARRALFQKLMEDIKALLNAEQKATLEKLMERRRPDAPPAEPRPERPKSGEAQPRL